MRARDIARVVTLVMGLGTAAVAQELAPGARYDPSIPTVKQVLGYEPGAEITPPDGIIKYLTALAAAAPDRCRLIEYGRTWEGRPLVLFVVASPERIAALGQVQAGIRALADPRTIAAGEADRLVRELPVVVWLMHAVHGNEISSSDAALFEAYHLLAAIGDPVADGARRNTVVLIDPLQNPDGRARFVTQNLLGRAAVPDPEPLSAEHDEPWPGGRSNHYLFDMNRDWFSQSQPETVGRLRIALDWYPQVVVDLHEMGGESTYYFAPPADPINPYITKAQAGWLEAFGRANAATFDTRGFPYFTREVYDSFYPGYGESWPIFQGAVGMTYERASARGLAYRREDGSLNTFLDGVVQHFTAAITTIGTAAANRETLLRDFLEYRRSAVAEGERIAPREYVLVPGSDRSRAQRLAALLASQGIEVRTTADALSVGTRSVPAGAFVVSAAQPSGRLVRNLLEAHVPQPDAFVKEQDRRRKKRLGDQIYDVTGWSLPLLFDVETLALDRPAAVKTVPFAPAARPAWRAAKVAYLMPWGFDTAALVSRALGAGVKIRQSGEPFTAGGRRYDGGTAVVRVAENDAAGLDRLAALATEYPSVEVVALDSAWVDEGVSLGSNEVVALVAPRVLLAWDAPTSSLSAGWTRYVLERRFHLRTSAVRVSTLGRASLERFDVVVLPAGTYSPAIDDATLGRLKEWVRAGGTLVTLGEASRWAAREKVGLLDTRTEFRDGKPETDAGADADKGRKDAEPPKSFDLEKAVAPERERPENTPGAVIRVELDVDHWLASGHDAEIQVIVEGQRVFTPIRLDKGRNVGLYAAKERLVAGGLAWDEARDQLARKAFLVAQPLGRGHVIAFAEDPNYRAFTEATELLFANAVLLGPAH
jgi:hypothetical protein